MHKQTGIGIRLLDAAVSRKNDPRAHLYIDDFTRPGMTLVRHVEVSNFTPAPAHLLLYAAAAEINRSGWAVMDGRAANELTSWIRVEPGAVDLPPGRSAVATVTIDVPREASAGERYGAVLAELPAPARQGGANVSVATRVGVRVYLDVGPGGEPRSDFTISTLTPARDASGAPEVTAEVTNTGERALDVGGTLDLSNGPGGLRAGPYQVSVPRTIGVGQTAGVVVRLDMQTPAGPWTAKMVLKSGYVAHAAEASVTFPSRPGASAAPVKAKPVPLAKDRRLLVPLAAGLALALLIALGLFLLWRRRRRDEDGDVAAAGGPPSLPGPRVSTDEHAAR